VGDVARFAYRHHLVRLVARSEVAAARLDAASPERRVQLADAARRDAARLSARLDASPLTDETADAVDAGEAGPGKAAGTDSPGAGMTVAGRPSGWAAALRLDVMPTQAIAAVEYTNLLATYELETELAEDFFAAPLAALTALHGRLVAGMVQHARVGQLRAVAQDVHDGAQGMVIYRTPPPEALPRLLDSLLSWLGRGSAGVPALVVAGVVHERLLEWQPFDAANGRLARAAARVVLRARGLDPHGLAVPERTLARDPVGYFGEVAASIHRRGDLTAWLERTGEAVVRSLETAADTVSGEPPPAPPPRAVDVAARMTPGEGLSLVDYVGRAGVDRDTAASDLEMLDRSGLLEVVPGTQGLRLRRTGREVG
jgi:hypothetical protein